MTKRIGWLGLGKMGEPMAANILKAGHHLSVWNRTEARAQALVTAGALFQPTPVQAVERCDILFTMVSDDEALRDLFLRDSALMACLPRGAVLVEMSTVSPTISSEISVLADRYGVLYLRAPVSGSVAMAQAAKLSVIASGPEEAFESVRPVLEAMSQRQTWVGAGDEARIVKLVVNHLVGSTAALVGEAVALGEKAGVAREVMLDVLGTSAVASPLVGYKLDMLRSRNYAPAFAVSQMAKDFGLILDAGRECGAPLPLAALIFQNWTAMIAQGDGEQDFFKYVELARKQAGLAPFERA